MVQVIWSRRAARELVEIENRIFLDSPLAAEGLADKLKAAAATLSEHPNRGRLTASGVRELLSVRPYRIRYVQVGAIVRIVELRHMKRRPPR